MFNRKLRQRIIELEGNLIQASSKIEQLEATLQKAATYHDASPYECPLCSEVDPVTKIPVTYCSLHLQIAALEKEMENACVDFRDVATSLGQIANTHRETIDKMMIMLLSKPFKLSPKQVELLAAIVSESELRSQTLARQAGVGSSWLYELTYLEKSE